MELLNALLGGFFLWLFVFRASQLSLARTRREAGGLLLRVHAAPDLPRKRWPWELSACLMVSVVAGVIRIVRAEQTDGSWFVLLAIHFAASLWFAVPIASTSIALEVRERGVLHNMWGRRGWPGRLSFTPWSEMDDCVWGDTQTLGIGRPRRFKLSLRAIEPASQAAVAEAVGRFVPVYDSELTPLAQPDAARDAGTSAVKRPTRRPLLQFELQLLLILTAVVACAANGYGIRYRRSQPMRESLDRLERFQPEATYLGGTMVELDFSPCVTKPRDDDLANVESLDGLVTLNLDGAPVTDAGLTHLTGLKNLRVLVLTGTKVSDDGARRVKKAIPRLGIFR